MRKILLSILIISSLPLFAGRYAGDFMAIGSGVRSLGLGGAYAAIADEGSAIYWNASGIAQIRRTEIGAMRAFLYEGLAYYDNFTFCQPLPNAVTLGFNWTRLTIDDIPYYGEEHITGTNVDQRSSDLEWILNEVGVPDRKFKSYDDLFQFAFAKHIHYDLNMGWLFYDLPLDFYIGSNIKYIRRKIDEIYGTGTGFDFSGMLRTDMAVLFDVEWLGELSVGMNFQDVGGTSITWETESNHEDEVLFNTKLGFAVFQPLEFIESELVLAFDIDYVYETVHHFGAEYLYKKFLNVRAGYYNDNFSAGMSVKVYDISLDYAFLTNVLGNTNRVGLRISF